VSRNIYVNQAILEDPDYLVLSHEAGRAWWHLRFDPRMGISGLARMSWRSMRDVFDLAETRSRNVLGELTRKWYRYDEAKGLLWLVDAFRHERNRSPQVLAAVVKEVKSCPRSPVLSEWWSAYELAFMSSKEERRDLSIYIQGASMGHGEGLDGVLARDSGSGQAPVLPEQDPAKRAGARRRRRGTPDPEPAYTPAFLRAWAAYQHGPHCRKKTAFRVWVEQELESKVEDVIAWAGSIPARDDRQFIPAMQSWLEGNDFRDALATISTGRCKGCGSKPTGKIKIGSDGVCSSCVDRIERERARGASA